MYYCHLGRLKRETNVTNNVDNVDNSEDRISDNVDDIFLTDILDNNVKDIFHDHVTLVNSYDVSLSDENMSDMILIKF